MKQTVDLGHFGIPAAITVKNDQTRSTMKALEIHLFSPIAILRATWNAIFIRCIVYPFGKNCES